MAELRDAGAGTHQIADVLTAEGHPTKRGGRGRRPRSAASRRASQTATTPDAIPPSATSSRWGQRIRSSVGLAGVESRDHRRPVSGRVALGASTTRGALVSDNPNILIIWGDDIGVSNLSCYSDGVMGYRTRNIDRIAEEGVRFTDYYGEQSCTAGRAAFITGQNPYRTGLTKVGMPGATLGPAAARTRPSRRRLKAQGYATGQFGKNHLGDRDEHLPTMHGFDEFFGNLYHLNAEEEPELPDYPKDPGVPGEVRAARGPAHLGQPRRHPAHRGHRPADQEADGNRATRSSATPQSISSTASTRRRRRSSCGSTPRTCISAPIPKPESVGPLRALAVRVPRHDARSRRPGR